MIYELEDRKGIINGKLCRGECLKGERNGKGKEGRIPKIQMFLNSLTSLEGAYGIGQYIEIIKYIFKMAYILKYYIY